MHIAMSLLFIRIFLSMTVAMSIYLQILKYLLSIEPEDVNNVSEVPNLR